MGRAVHTTLLRRHSATKALDEKPASVCIGNFDGLHQGHKKLILATGAARPKGGRVIVVSFYPHPGEVLGKSGHLPRITTLRQKLSILAEWGVDVLYLVHFTCDFANLTASDFIQKILLESLHTSILVIGPDARVGRDKQGTPDFIARELSSAGKECRSVSFVDEAGEPISSRRIRALLVEGKVHEAAKLLGRSFSYQSKVIHGDARGRKLGFPTANLLMNGQVVPCLGVYAARVRHRGALHNAVVNIGVRPTFGGTETSIEAHLLEYRGPDFYGECIDVEFVERVRAEMKFPGVEALKDQIGQDIKRATQILRSGAL